jgi:hypothetical protein
MYRDKVQGTMGEAGREMASVRSTILKGWRKEGLATRDLSAWLAK